MSTINGKTPICNIKEWMQDDFGVLLTSKQAREIRASRARNTSTWNPRTAYVNTNMKAVIWQINDSGVRAGLAFYSTDEWNRAIRAGEFE